MSTRESRAEADLPRIRETLDATLDDLDGATASRLTRARHAALAHLPARHRIAWRSPLAVASATMLVLLALALRPTAPPPPPVPSETFAMLADESDRELLASMEFYLWLGDEAGDED